VVFFFRKSSFLKGNGVPFVKKLSFLTGSIFIDLIIAYDLIKSILEKIVYLDYN